MKKKIVDHDYSLTEVGGESKKGLFSMFVIMLGFTFFSASMWTGGTLGAGLSSAEFILAVLAGNLILGGYTGALAFIGAKTGLSTHLLARYSFGEKGSYLGSALLALTQIGWFGVGVAMFAIPVNRVTGIDTTLLIYVSGLLMTATAFFGIKAVTILSAIAVPSIAVLGGVSVFGAVDHIGGIGSLMAVKPMDNIGLITGVSMCIGSFISGGTLTADFARFSKDKKTGVMSAVVAFFIGNSLMFLFGAVGAKVFNTSDISEVMFKQGLIIPAIIVLGFNIWTTNDNALYSSGLGFSNIFNMNKSKIVVVNGILGTIFAMALYNNFVGWLAMLNTLLPSIGGVILADYFFVKKGNYDTIKDAKFQTVNWIAIASWGAGVLAAKFIPGIAPLNSVVATMAIYTIAMKASAKEKTVKEVTA